MITTVFLVLAVGAVPASAGEPLVIVDDAVIGAKPGSLTNLAEVAVQADRVGSLCTIVVHSRNQSSV